MHSSTFEEMVPLIKGAGMNYVDFFSYAEMNTNDTNFNFGINVFCLSLVIFLSGCQSYIAYQITKPPQKVFPKEFESSIALSGVRTHYCSSEVDCLDFRFISPKDIESYLLDGNTLSLSLIVGGSTEDEVFEYQLT